MHVLLLALNYWPDKLGNAPLMTGLAEGLAARGHRVTVVCAFPHHEKGQIEAPYRGKLFQREHHQGVDIRRVWLYAPEGGAVAKMANYASFTMTALAAAIRVPDVDVVFTPSPPLTLGLVDQVVSAFRRVPFVYNLQDLFPEAAVRLGVLSNPRAIRTFEALERHVYRKAHHLSIISEAFRQHLLDRDVPNHKISYIPNYTDTEFITPLDSEENPYRAAHQLDDTFVIQFSGRMGYSQGLDTVIAAWRKLDDLPDARLMMVGDGQARPMVDEALTGDPRAVVLPTQARSDLPQLLAASDVGLAPLRRGMAGTCIPSKMFGIMAAGRPMVASLEAGSDAARMVDRAQCGRVVPPEDADALATTLRQLYQDRKSARKMGASARQYVEAHHSQDVVVDQYETMLRDVVGRGRG